MKRSWRLSVRLRLYVVTVMVALATSTVAHATNREESSPRPGDAFDAAPFGFVLEDGAAHACGVRWAEPRKIRRLVVEFAEGDVPAVDNVRVQYWHGSWDAKPESVLAEKGAGGVGWEVMDDWTNGKWKDADTQIETRGRTWVVTFAPTGAKEFPTSAPGVTYRKTLQVRLVGTTATPKIARLQAITDAVYQPVSVRVMFGKPAASQIAVASTEMGKLEVFNGVVLGVRPIAGAEVTESGWRLTSPADAGIEADVLMAVDPLNPGFDRTVVTVRSDSRPFSFNAEEAARRDRILVDDLGVLVTRADDAIGLVELRARRKELAGRTVYSRVFDKTEQTLAGAWEAMPLKRPLYFVHGLPGDRNAMHQHADGTVVIAGWKRWFDVPPSDRDTTRKLWAGATLQLGFGFPHDQHVPERSLKDGYLPLLSTVYRDGVLQYEQRTVLDALSGDMQKVAIDDPSVLLMHVRIVNTSRLDSGTARLQLSAKPEGAATTEKLAFVGDRVNATFNGKSCLRYLIHGLDGGKIEAAGNDIRWVRTLGPAEACDVYFLIPSITLDKDAEIAALAKRDFDSDAARICRYWQDVTSRGCSIQTPEPWLNDFYKAHLQHMLVNCYKEIGSDRLHAHVGTLGYGVYPDESVMMISDLDRRGYHDEARRCYQSFLDYQGTQKMPGNFKSAEGCFYGAGGHSDGGYNKSHGWVLWGLAEHWRYTHDREWMKQAAAKLVAGCDWVTRERQATMTLNKDGSRPIEYGFLPTGSLEDVTDYWTWMVTNACTDWGFQAIASALAEYGHHDAPRLQADAKAFHDDIMRGIEESRVLAPVVKLRDGTYVPKYPSRLYERGRSHGWLRETLEGSIHLLITGLLDCNSPNARWILDDFEDNLYISNDYGYAIPVFDHYWFSRGGFSMQANLLGGPLPYLERDEIKHFLRAYFNSFCSAFYPDTRMCNEHSLPELGCPAGDHFKTSDEAQSTYWLRLMFVHEREGNLILGQAIPRYWMENGKGASIERAATHYGPLSLKLSSQVDQGRITAVLDRDASDVNPKTIYLRVRHPKAAAIKQVELNGKPYERFDSRKEWVELPGDTSGRVELIVQY